MITLKNHYTYEGKQANRLLLGEPMPIIDSNLRIEGKLLNIPGTTTGSIGFFDYLFSEEMTLPESIETGKIARLKALRVPYLGIEPPFQGNGFLSLIMGKLEQIAMEKRCRAVTIEEVKNPKLIIWGNRHGYKPYWDYRNILRYV